MSNWVVGGPPGSGKTTWVREHARRGDVIVDVDALFVALSGRPLYDKPTRLLDLVLGVRDYVTQRIAAGDMPQDAYVITSSGRRDVLATLQEQLGADLVVLEVDADECKQRLRNDPRRDAETDWPALVDAWWAEYAATDGETERMGDVMEFEKRVFAIEDLEVRQATDDEPPVIRGYAALYDVETDLGEFREVIRPGAFKAAVARDDVRALFNHDPNYVLGRTTARTLFLDEDETGLPVVIMPPEAQWARDMMTSMQRGDINQMSFAFSVDAQTWDNENRDKPLRELRDVTLYDVSVVTYPAYPETSAAVRAEARALSEQDTQAGGADQAGSEPDNKRAGGKQALNAAKLRLARLGS